MRDIALERSSIRKTLIEKKAGERIKTYGKDRHDVQRTRESKSQNKDGCNCISRCCKQNQNTDLDEKLGVIKNKQIRKKTLKIRCKVRVRKKMKKKAI